ncbi:MAG TPA: putative lipid II flippase FtsW [Gammaproteobacteria bacterium]|jgi:cell division protein FtsW
MRFALAAPAKIDPALAGATLGLVALGVVMVGSASVALADRTAGEPLYYLLRHVAALGAGSVCLVLAMLIPTETWHRASGALLLLGIALLVLVLLPQFGVTVNGSSRWLDFGALGVQASEPARLCVLIYLASYAVRHQATLTTSTKSFLRPMLIVAAVCLLLLAEPDFGATVVVVATSLGVLFVAGARLRDFVLAAAVAGGALGALALSSAYRLERLTAFLDPWGDPYASGFQLTNSLIAIGRGDWLGVGLGASVQKLFYLPEAHTDFVFAVVAEELGFAGSTLVIGLFAVLVYRALLLGQKALAAGRQFQGLLCYGIGLMLGLEAFINIGVNTGLLPTKGLTLPLISYGRSSAVVTLAALGLLLRVAWELAIEQQRPKRRSRA